MLPLLLACAPHMLHPVAPTQTPRGEPGAHAWATTEWWHVHADLRDVQTGEALHVFTAFVVERTDHDRLGPLPVRWFVNPMQSAWTRLEREGQAWTAQRHAWPDGFAARNVEGAPLDLQHNGWRVAWDAGSVLLTSSAGPARVDLRLSPTRATVHPGDGGRVALAGRTQLWEQDEAMRVDGRWIQDGEVHWVEGTGFFKHEWGEMPMAEVDGFEWLSLDLKEGSLSVAWLMNDGMSGVAGSSAWVSASDGTTTPLPARLLKVEATRTWRSPLTGTEWPTAWHLQGPALDLVVESTMEDQEIRAFPTPIRAGPAHATGQVLGEEVDGPAFTEQVGAKLSLLRPLFRSTP